MVEQILSFLAGIVISVIEATGYWGVAILMAIESACVPLPSELIMPFAGYLVSQGKMNLYLAATAGALGCNLGSIVAYEVGKRGGRPFVLRYGKYLLIGADELDAADRFFVRWGSAAVFVGRLLPVIRTFIAFPAGVARMPLVPFHIYTFVGSWPFCFALAWVGRELGAAWHGDPRVRAVFHSLDAVIGVAIVVAVIWYVRHRLKAIRKSKAELAAIDRAEG
ncbi:MAG: DedA family protein [Sphingomonadales bacterium]|nr:DedA family protein [Sphingomonadales bacterium]